MAYWEKNTKGKGVMVLVVEISPQKEEEPKPVALFNAANVKAAQAWVESQGGAFKGLYPWHSPASPPRTVTLAKFYKRSLVKRKAGKT